VNVAALQNEAPVPADNAIFATFRLRSHDSGQSARVARGQAK